MKYEFSKEQINNLLVFLDKVNYKGLKEAQAINEIIISLNNPIKEDEINK